MMSNNSSCIRIRPRISIVSSSPRRLTLACVILAVSLVQLWNSMTMTRLDRVVVSPMVGNGKDEQILMLLQRHAVSSSIAEQSVNKQETINSLTTSHHPDAKEENDTNAATISSMVPSSSSLLQQSAHHDYSYLSPATKCRLRLQNQTARILVENYVHQGRPFLQNVVQIIENEVHYYVIILSVTPFTKWRKIWYTRQPQVLWKCHYYHHADGSSNATTTTVAAQMVKQDGDGGPDLILSCPHHNDTTTPLLLLDMVSLLTLLIQSRT